MSVQRPMRRLSWLLRDALHDWMWECGDRAECGWPRRLARLLPLYFSDPNAHDLRNFDPESVTWTRTVGPPSMFIKVEPTTTTTLGAGATVTYRYGR